MLKWSGTCGNKQMVLYKATRDGFTHKDFQLKCYGKGEVWVIISDVKGNVFGGYTSRGWKGRNKITKRITMNECLLAIKKSPKKSDSKSY